MANGGDNIAVYIALFGQQPFWSMARANRSGAESKVLGRIQMSQKSFIRLLARPSSGRDDANAIPAPLRLFAQDPKAR